MSLCFVGFDNGFKTENMCQEFNFLLSQAVASRNDIQIILNGLNFLTFIFRKLMSELGSNEKTKYSPYIYSYSTYLICIL